MFHLFEILAVFIEVYTVYVLHASWLQRKHLNRWQVLLAYFLFAVYSVIFSIFFPDMRFLSAIIFIGISGLSIFLHDVYFALHFFSSFILISVGAGFEVLVPAIQSAIFNIRLDQIYEPGLDRIWSMLTAKLLCLIVVRYLALILRKHKVTTARNMRKILPLMICQFVIILLMTAIIYDAFHFQGVMNLLNILEVIVLIFISIFIFSYYDNLATSYESDYRNQLAQIQMDNIINHYNDIKERQDILIAIRHDILFFFDAIDSFVSGGEYDEAFRYSVSIRNMLDVSIEDKRDIILTPNVIVSSFLNQYLRKAKEIGVTVEHDINIPAKLGISDIDMTIIMGNVLQNAIEALEAVDGVRFLSITMKQNDFFLFFEVSNTFDPLVVKSNHPNQPRGYGLRNVIACVNKYGGQFSTSTNNDTFTSTAIINSLPIS